jgi:hypothetical protein
VDPDKLNPDPEKLNPDSDKLNPNPDKLNPDSDTDPAFQVSPQIRTSSTSKNDIFLLSSVFVGHFCPPWTGFRSRDPIESGSYPDSQQ